VLVLGIVQQLGPSDLDKPSGCCGLLPICLFTGGEECADLISEVRVGQSAAASVSICETVVALL
jgi:hypothetical protein